MKMPHTQVPSWLGILVAAFCFSIVIYFIYFLFLDLGITTSIEIVGFLTLASVAIILWRRSVDQRARRQNPKDYAFYLYARWGRTLRLRPIERLRRGFPERPTADLEVWLNDFRVLDAFLASLIERACSEVLTLESVQLEVQKEFPFLDNKGLKEATFRVGYGALREGHPLKKP